MCPVSCSRFQNGPTEGGICLPRGPHLLLALPIQLNQGVIRGCLSSIAGLETTDPFYRERSDIFLGGKIKAQNTHRHPLFLGSLKESAETAKSKRSLASLKESLSFATVAFPSLWREPAAERLPS